MERDVTLPKPKAVIFDWDDTVVNNWEIAVKTFNATLVHMGMEAWSEPDIRRRTGQSARDIFMSLFGERWQEADHVYYRTFMDMIAGNVRIHDNIENVLKTLKENDVYMAVVSNKRGELLRKEAESIGFAPYFGAIVGAGDAEKDKPDPAPVLMALKGSGISPSPDVWFIGDSHADMQCAHNSGCSAVLIETKPPPADMLADCLPSHRFPTHMSIMEFLSAHFR